MKIFDTVEGMREFSASKRRANRSIAFVPTMGALHEGHISLLRYGRKAADILVISIYVNPTQFGPTEDLRSYPRDLDGDLARAKSAGADAVFLPSDDTIYPKGFQTFVEVGELSKPLCGLSRPGHFRGVATVVAKLLNIVSPDIAIFGEKDFQQLAVIRRMVADLDMPVEIVGRPIVREPDGLAMSSRNMYLTAKERAAALSISRSLTIAQGMVESGEKSAKALLCRVRAEIEEAGLARIDYAGAVDPETLEEKTELIPPFLLALAVFVGRTRLIDNRLFS